MGASPAPRESIAHRTLPSPRSASAKASISHARKREFCKPFQVDFGRPVAAREIYRFTCDPDRWLHHIIPPQEEGRTRDRHDTRGGTAVDADALQRRTAFLRTAKSCGPGAPTLALSSR